VASNVDEMWAADDASRRLGMELEELGDGHARVRMTVVEWMLNGHRICHGGLVFTLAQLGDVLVAEAHARTRFGRSGIYDVTVRRTDGTVVAEFRGHSRVVGRAPAAEG
jgi:acyl-CoA thioesterase